jgi:hypothetical protein
MENVLNKVQPLVEKRMGSGPEPSVLLRDKTKHGVGKFISIDVSPMFDVTAKMAARDSFHDNNNAMSDSGEVARVNGALVTADFSNSLHDNNNAIGKGDVERLNGVGFSEESSTDTLGSALGSIGAMAAPPASSSPQQSVAELAQKQWNPLMLRQTKGHGHRRGNSTVGTNTSSEVDGLTSSNATNSWVNLVYINVSPKFKIAAGTDLTGSFYANNNAVSGDGPVQRVNGALVDANFSGSLHDNNAALSYGGNVERVNGVARQ